MDTHVSKAIAIVERARLLAPFTSRDISACV